MQLARCSHSFNDKAAPSVLRIYPSLDKKGNRTQRYDDNGAGTTYGYDGRNRLTSSVTTDGNNNLLWSSSYAYDAFDRRVAKDADATSNTPAQHLRYTYNGDKLLLALDQDGNVKDRFLNGPQVDQVLADEEVTGSGAGTSDWLMQDEEQSVVNIAQRNPSTGVVTPLWNGTLVAPFGQDYGVSPVTMIGYAGGISNPELGLTLMGRRYYDSQAGRFVTTDPANSGPNPYTYADNDPINNVDPTGLSSFSASSGYGYSSGAYSSPFSYMAPATIPVSPSLISTYQSAIASPVTSYSAPVSSFNGGSAGGYNPVSTSISHLASSNSYNAVVNPGTGYSYNPAPMPASALLGTQPNWNDIFANVQQEHEMQIQADAAAKWHAIQYVTPNWAQIERKAQAQAGSLGPVFGPIVSGLLEFNSTLNRLVGTGARYTENETPAAAQARDVSQVAFNWSTTILAGASMMPGRAPIVQSSPELPILNNEPFYPNFQRLPQDIAVDPVPTQTLKLQRSIGGNAAQYAELQRDIQTAKKMGAYDFRVNQQQTNAAGVRVGENFPDLQFTLKNQQRVYVEYDTPTSQRGLPHLYRIQANDPVGKVILKTIPSGN